MAPASSIRRRILLGRTVAVKALLPLMGRELLHGEGRSLARIDHPNVVAIHDLIEDRGRPYLVMEYVEGCTLQQWLDDHGPMRADQALNFVRQIGAALAAAHAEGMLHCDLKPSNIMLSDAGAAKLTDFTLARHRVGERYHGVSGSSPQFAAPEQIEGEEIDARTDVYSLGKLLDCAISPQTRTRRDRQTREAIERATAAVPADRFASIEEMLAALPAPARDVTRVAAHSRLSDLTRVAPVAAAAKLPMPGRRRLWGIAAVPAAGLLAAAGLVGHFQASASPETVTLPGLTGTQGSSAQTVTRSLQLQPYVVPRYLGHRAPRLCDIPTAGRRRERQQKQRGDDRCQPRSPTYRSTVTRRSLTGGRRETPEATGLPRHHHHVGHHVARCR